MKRKAKWPQTLESNEQQHTHTYMKKNARKIYAHTLYANIQNEVAMSVQTEASE